MYVLIVGTEKLFFFVFGLFRGFAGRPLGEGFRGGGESAAGAWQARGSFVGGEGRWGKESDRPANEGGERKEGGKKRRKTGAVGWTKE